jgi:hypothetical protein
MNSRERILTTLRHGRADRVPMAEMWIDPKVVREIILPCDARVVASIKKAGGYVIKHT